MHNIARHRVHKDEIHSYLEGFTRLREEINVNN